MIDKILSFPGNILLRLSSNTYFKAIAENPYKATFVLVAIVVFFSFPSYDVAYVTDEMASNWSAVFLQSKEPFIPHDYAPGSHEEKLAFRFVPAIILHLLRIENITGAFIFQFGTVILFYFLLTLVLNQLFKDKIKAFIFALPVCFVMAGHVYTTDYKGVFDTLALDFLLMAVLCRHKVYVIIPLLLAYYTDERALIASPGIFLINLLDTDQFENIRSIIRQALSKSSIYLYVSWIFYFIMRLYLSIVVGLTTGTGGVSFFFDQINKTFYTIYTGLEGFLIPFILILAILIRKRIYAFTALFILSFLLLFYVAQSVTDINRSMSYVLLVLLLTLILLNKLYPTETVFKIMAWVILISIMYDDFYPFAAQVYRMKFITHTI